MRKISGNWVAALPNNIISNEATHPLLTMHSKCFARDAAT